MEFVQAIQIMDAAGAAVWNRGEGGGVAARKDRQAGSGFGALLLRDGRCDGPDSGDATNGDEHGGAQVLRYTCRVHGAYIGHMHERARMGPHERHVHLARTHVTYMCWGICVEQSACVSSAIRGIYALSTCTPYARGT